MEDTLFRNFKVSSYDVNPEARVRLTSIANYLQETAYTHANALELGYHHLLEKHKAWILARMRIRMLKYPLWDSELQIETWPSGIEKLFALRNFKIENSKREKIAEASTCWLMVDTETHRPFRIPPDFIKFETRTDSVFEASPGKIELPSEMKLSEIRKVKYSDLDLVGHVNNVKFIEWCLDIIEAERIISKGVSDFLINYISEAYLGDQIQLSCSEKTENGIYIAGVNLKNSKECFRAKLVI